MGLPRASSICFIKNINKFIREKEKQTENGDEGDEKRERVSLAHNTN